MYRGKLIANTPRPTWHLKRKPSGKDAHCPSCFKTVSEGRLHIEATALWQPRDREQAINRNFQFCLMHQSIPPSRPFNWELECFFRNFTSLIKCL